MLSIRFFCLGRCMLRSSAVQHQERSMGLGAGLLGVSHGHWPTVQLPVCSCTLGLKSSHLPTTGVGLANLVLVVADLLRKPRVSLNFPSYINFFFPFCSVCLWFLLPPVRVGVLLGDIKASLLFPLAKQPQHLISLPLGKCLHFRMHHGTWCYFSASSPRKYMLK